MDITHHVSSVSIALTQGSAFHFRSGIKSRNSNCPATQKSNKLIKTGIRSLLGLSLKSQNTYAHSAMHGSQCRNLLTFGGDMFKL
jgi:hypothetical protein